LILASFGLGGVAVSIWLTKYKWVFMIITFVLLGFAFYRTYKDRTKTGPWGMGMLYGTTVLSIGLIVYTLVFK